MRLSPYRNVACAAALLLSGPQIASATPLSYSGQFNYDNDVQFLTFTLNSTTDVILKTLSFGGGTSAVGSVTIQDDGFTPMLYLFAGTTGTATFITRSVDPGLDCSNPNAGNPDSDTGLCWDAYISQQLSAGTYTVALTQWGNTYNGQSLPNPILSDGFNYSDAGTDFPTNPNPNNFTAWANSTGFWEWNVLAFGDQRTANWAVDILISDVPEPETLPLTLTGLAALGLFVRRKSIAVSPVS